MKISRDEPYKDPCSTCIELLVEKVENFFISTPQLASKKRFYPDLYTHQDLTLLEDDILDVVLFGSAFRKIFESGNWPKCRYRIWVLCSSFKKFLENDFFKNEGAVGVIPRELLFKVAATDNYDFSKPFDLIYGGRLSSQKNIKYLLSTVAHLQDLGVPCDLHLFGDVDNNSHEDLGRRLHQLSHDDLLKYSDELSWIRSPQFHAKESSDSWYKHSFKQPTFITLSTFICEDFGASVAQAQEQGWPVVLSDFGGHKDVESGTFLKVPYSLCLNDHYCDDLLKYFSKYTANFIKERSLSSHESSSSCEFIAPKELSYEDLDLARRESLNFLGSSLSLINHEYLSDFADNSRGAVYLKSVKKYLEGPHPKNLIIGFDFDHDSYSSKELSLLEGHISSNPECIRSCRFISSKNIFKKEWAKELLEAERVVLWLPSGQAEKFAAALKEKFHLNGDQIIILE